MAGGGGNAGTPSALKTFPMNISMSSLVEELRAMQEGEITHNAFPVVDMKGTLLGLVSRKSLQMAVYSDELTSKEQQINLVEYMDRSPITVYPHTPLSRAFIIFRKLGMRHLCVIDRHGKAQGIITRKDLMTYRLEECAEEVRHFEGDDRGYSYAHIDE